MNMNFIAGNVIATYVIAADGNLASTKVHPD